MDNFSQLFTSKSHPHISRNKTNNRPSSKNSITYISNSKVGEAKLLQEGTVTVFIMYIDFYSPLKTEGLRGQMFSVTSLLIQQLYIKMSPLLWCTQVKRVAEEQHSGTEKC